MLLLRASLFLALSCSSCVALSIFDEPPSEESYFKYDNNRGTIRASGAFYQAARILVDDLKHPLTLKAMRAFRSLNVQSVHFASEICPNAMRLEVCNSPAFDIVLTPDRDFTYGYTGQACFSKAKFCGLGSGGFFIHCSCMPTLDLPDFFCSMHMLTLGIIPATFSVEDSLYIHEDPVLGRPSLLRLNRRGYQISVWNYLLWPIWLFRSGKAICVTNPFDYTGCPGP